jgi:hypothetical protein
MFFFVLLLVCLSAPLVRAQCAPTFPVLNTCTYSSAPPSGSYSLNRKDTAFVSPSAISLVFDTNGLYVVYSIQGTFTFAPPGIAPFASVTTVSWRGVWSTVNPDGESCGCSCSGVLLLASPSAASNCVDTYFSTHPDVKNFCDEFAGMMQYWSGQFYWAKDQDVGNPFLLLSRTGVLPGFAATTNSFVPYSAVPGTVWGQSVTVFTESGAC